MTYNLLSLNIINLGHLYSENVLWLVLLSFIRGIPTLFIEPPVHPLVKIIQHWCDRYELLFIVFCVFVFLVCAISSNFLLHQLKKLSIYFLWNEYSELHFITVWSLYDYMIFLHGLKLLRVLCVMGMLKHMVKDQDLFSPSKAQRMVPELAWWQQEQWLQWCAQVGGLCRSSSHHSLSGCFVLHEWRGTLPSI